MHVHQLVQGLLDAGAQGRVVSGEVVDQDIGDGLCVGLQPRVLRGAGDDAAEQKNRLQRARLQDLALLLHLVDAVGNLGADLVGLAQALANLVVDEVAADDAAQGRLGGRLHGFEGQTQLRAQLDAGARGVGAAQHPLPQPLSRRQDGVGRAEHGLVVATMLIAALAQV